MPVTDASGQERYLWQQGHTRYMTCAGLFILCKTFPITCSIITYIDIHTRVCMYFILYSCIPLQSTYTYAYQFYQRDAYKVVQMIHILPMQRKKIFAKILIAFYNLMGVDIWFLLCKCVDNHITMSFRKTYNCTQKVMPWWMVAIPHHSHIHIRTAMSEVKEH